MGYKYPTYVYLNVFHRIRSRIVYGLQAEHTMEDQVYWRGNGGKVYFYQNELPYINPYYWKRGLAPDRSPVFEFPSIESRSNDTRRLQLWYGLCQLPRWQWLSWPLCHRTGSVLAKLLLDLRALKYFPFSFPWNCRFSHWWLRTKYLSYLTWCRTWQLHHKHSAAGPNYCRCFSRPVGQSFFFGFWLVAHPTKEMIYTPRN